MHRTMNHVNRLNNILIFNKEYINGAVDSLIATFESKNRKFSYALSNDRQ